MNRQQWPVPPRVLCWQLWDDSRSTSLHPGSYRHVPNTPRGDHGEKSYDHVVGGAGAVFTSVVLQVIEVFNIALPPSVLEHGRRLILPLDILLR